VNLQPHSTPPNPIEPLLIDLRLQLNCLLQLQQTIPFAFPLFALHNQSFTNGDNNPTVESDNVDLFRALVEQVFDFLEQYEHQCTFVRVSEVASVSGMSQLCICESEDEKHTGWLRDLIGAERGVDLHGVEQMTGKLGHPWTSTRERDWCRFVVESSIIWSLALSFMLASG
jgi:hypothetical protein